MYASTLKSIMNLKRMSASELARQAGISRQAVSKWFVASEKNGSNQINPDWNTIKQVAVALKIKPAQLTQNIFEGISPEEKSNITTLLLWDHLYPSLEDYLAALVRVEHRAVARYVQTFGILKAEKIFGKMVFIKFDLYSQFIHPVLRKELKQLCLTLQELNLI